MWMDHRAKEQAERINASNHHLLKYVGGKMSPEMQCPKVLWLKENLPDVYSNVEYFFDLSDYLSWKATSSDFRSMCTAVCKWTYEVGDAGNLLGWNKSFFKEIGLSDLMENNCKKIGSNFSRS